MRLNRKFDNFGLNACWILLIQYTTKTHCGWCKLSSLHINVFLIWITFLFSSCVVFVWFGNADVIDTCLSTPKYIGYNYLKKVILTQFFSTLPYYKMIFRTGSIWAHSDVNNHWLIRIGEAVPVVHLEGTFYCIPAWFQTHSNLSTWIWHIPIHQTLCQSSVLCI